MNNIEPWCISRQLWWGHQIPAWYGPDKKIFVEINETEAKKSAKKFYKKEVKLIRDPDVLDTWFSSGLWPFATLGWPNKNQYLKKFYPTTVLVTGFDIIFFWVARMIMFGMDFLNKEPFKDIYVHALVRDEKGQKMSKSYDNQINMRDDPDRVANALRKMPTDPARQRRNDPGDPDKCPVWGLHKVYTDSTLQQKLSEGCRSAAIGCLDCKKPLIEVMFTIFPELCALKIGATARI